MPKLDRLVPPDWEHVRKFALADLPSDTTPPRGVPVVLAGNWYTNFDNPVPVKHGKVTIYMIGSDGKNLGTVRGGHCICTKPGKTSDSVTWWTYYNQGEEGACVSFGENRCMTLLNRKEYDPWPLYKLIEQPGGGALTRDGLEVLRTGGPFLKGSDKQSPEDGISAYRWLLSVAEVHQVLDNSMADKLGAVPILNSWGKDFPHIVYMTDEALERFLKEDGEAAVVTDK